MSPVGKIGIHAGANQLNEANEIRENVETCRADVAEMTHFNPSDFQQGVSTQLAEAKAAEGHALQPDLILANFEVHHELLGGWALADLAHQPELVGTGTTVEVVGSSASQHIELVVASTAKGAIGRAADAEAVVAEAAAEAVAIAGFGTQPIITTATGDHIAGAGVDGVHTGASEDAVLEAVAEGHIHLVVAGPGEDGIADQREVLTGIGLNQGVGTRGANNRLGLNAGQIQAKHKNLTAVISLGGFQCTTRLTPLLNSADEDMFGEGTTLFNDLSTVASHFLFCEE